ncbi:Hsp70 family protein [Escherichia coli]
MGKIIGIDLGTTNSCVAIMDGTTSSCAGERRRQSHHAFYHCLSQDGETLVGQPAKR